jgi:transposase-like protein
MTNDDYLAGYLIHFDQYGRARRYRCNKCGSYIQSETRKQRVWGGKVIHSKQPYCPTCKKFSRYYTRKMEDEIYKPYG